MSSEIDIVKINDVDDTKVQEIRIFRQHEVRYKTNNSDDATITEQFVGNNLDQDAILQSTRKIHSTTYYTANFSHKSYNIGTLHVNVYDPYTMVMSEEDTMIHILGVAMIQTFSLKKCLNKFGTRGENSVTK